MSGIQLLPIGSVDAFLLDELRSGLSAVFETPCEILTGELSGPSCEFADCLKHTFHPVRQQYLSTGILARMKSFLGARSDPASAPGERVLGVTPVDLYIPILTFVFGEAQMGQGCAVVSFYRLRQEFYGLPADPVLLHQRLLKEAVHELGHTLGLTHCEDYRCAMAPSHTVEWIDLKDSTFCANCRARMLAPHANS